MDHDEHTSPEPSDESSPKPSPESSDEPALVRGPVAATALVSWSPGTNRRGKRVWDSFASSDLPHLMVVGPKDWTADLVAQMTTQLRANNEATEVEVEVVEPGCSTWALRWAMAEMNQRYRAIRASGCRNFSDWHASVHGWRCPRVVLVVDVGEVGGDQGEFALTELARKARGCGIHLVVRTEDMKMSTVSSIVAAQCRKALMRGPGHGRLKGLGGTSIFFPAED